jgi:hypothetical protein
MIFGNAIGNTILLVVSHLLAPNPKLACLNVSSTAFNDSSVVLMITGSTNNLTLIHLLKLNLKFYSSQIMTFKTQNKMDGTPARLFVICLIIFLGQPSLHIHSCKLRLIHQQEANIISPKPNRCSK